IMLLAPMPPLMFMGEEWGARTPFPFFCDFQGELAEAVREGRRAEFKEAYARLGEQVPDPLDARTFASAKLDWPERDSAAGRRRVGRDLMAVRARRVMPLLAKMAFEPQATRFDGNVLRAGWMHPEGRLLLLANLSDEPARRPADWPMGASIWGGDADDVLPP